MHILSSKVPAILLCVTKATKIFAIASKICVTEKVEERDIKNDLAL